MVPPSSFTDLYKKRLTQGTCFQLRHIPDIGFEPKGIGRGIHFPVGMQVNHLIDNFLIPLQKILNSCPVNRIFQAVKP